jgi:TRAP-type transport system periplasmic protein
MSSIAIARGCRVSRALATRFAPESGRRRLEDGHGDGMLRADREVSMTGTSRTLLAALAAVLAFAAAASAQPARMKLATATIGKGDQNIWMEWFKERVEKRAGDKIKIDLFPGSQLGDNTRMTEGVQLGTIEGYVVPTSFLAPIDRRFTVFDAPGVFDTIEQAQRVVQDPAFRALMLGLGAPKDVFGISLWASGTSAVATRRPIRAIEDFRGLKLRVLGNKLEVDTMQKVGAAGVPMVLSETLPSLQTGVIDGAKLALVVSDTFKYWTITKFQTETDEALINSIVVVNKPWLDKLPGEVRQIMIEEAAKLDNEMHLYSLELRKGYRENWVKNGGELIKFAPAEQRKFLDLVRPVGEAFVADKPDLKAVYEMMVDLARKHK